LYNIEWSVGLHVQGKNLQKRISMPVLQVPESDMGITGYEDGHMHYFSGHGGETYSYAQGRNCCRFPSRCAMFFRTPSEKAYLVAHLFDSPLFAYGTDKM
jgi:hypothetical protein